MLPGWPEAEQLVSRSEQVLRAGNPSQRVGELVPEAAQQGDPYVTTHRPFW